jgi:hypothetical protein
MKHKFEKQILYDVVGNLTVDSDGNFILNVSNKDGNTQQFSVQQILSSLVDEDVEIKCIADAE